MNNEGDIYKKLLRAAKKKARKRTHAEMEEVEGEESKVLSKIRIDKEKIKDQVVDGEFEIKYLFSSAHIIEIPGSKIRSTRIFKSKKDYLLISSLHSNDLIVYSFKLNAETGQ